MPILAVGELLWDMLPTGPGLGGAPANVAFHLARRGAPVGLLSCVGRDAAGARAKQLLARAGVDVSLVFTDNSHPTGRVHVDLSAGEPHYEIATNAAWDHIPLPPEARATARDARALCLGSLVLRTGHQAGQILELVGQLRAQGRARPRIVVDLNLRPPFVVPQTCLDLLALADVAKVNAAELAWVGAELGASPVVPELFRRYPLEVIAVTRGAAGAELFTRDAHRTRPGRSVSGGDPVGAGDAFLAALTLALLDALPLEQALEEANEAAAWVASQRGAMPGLEQLAELGAPQDHDDQDLEDWGREP